MYACNGLENFVVDADNPSYASVDGILYNKKKKQPVGRAVRMESNRTDSARNGYADRKRGNGQQPESSESDSAGWIDQNRFLQLL